MSAMGRHLLRRGFSMSCPAISVPIKPNQPTLPSVRYGSCRYHLLHSPSGMILPRGSWDSHVHLIEPDKYPLPKNVKPPKEATMSQALANADRLALPNMVLVQLSTYGNDNAWVLGALKQLGSRGRGVVAFDPEHTDSATLRQWHHLGVRGVRLNLRSSNTVLTKTETQTTLRKYAEKLRPMKTWSIGLYADMDILDHVQPLVSELGVKLVLEHFGSPTSLPLTPAGQPGWDALTSMMEDPLVYVKISAPYLFCNDADFGKLESLAKALFTMRNGEGVVFGSDWPHTKSRGYDVKPFLEKVVEWCEGNKELQEKLFRDNAKDLWDA